MGKLFRRLYYLIHRRRLAAELETEMDFHREMAAQHGRTDFGNTLRLREVSHEAWGWTWLERLEQDLLYAARILWRSPAFTLTAVSVLAIGIGVNIAAFSLFNLAALKPLPVRDPSTLVRLQRRSNEMINSEMPYTSVVYYGENAKTLRAVIAVMGVPPMQIENDLQLTPTSFVTPNYFSELGTTAAMGRVFNPQEDNSLSAPPVAMLSYGLWQRRFGGDPSVVGKTIHVNGKQASVIGILPDTFASLGGVNPDLWLSISQQPYFVEGSKLFTDTSSGTVRMWARLAPGVTAKMAEAELLILTNKRREQTPKDIWEGEYIRSDPGGHLQVMETQEYKIAGMAAALTLLILAVACANLGGLLLARSVSRERELGIRIAIGASRGRIFRQLFTESLLLAVLGSLAGLVLAGVAIHATLTLADAPRWMSAMPDWRVLLFAAVMTVLTCVLFGLAPALQVAWQRQRKTLVRQTLVGAQVAASCVLLIVASLLVRALEHALYTDPGFGYEQVISVEPGLGQHGYTAPAAKALLEQTQTRLQMLPGVSSVALAKLAPMGHSIAKMGIDISGRQVDVYPNSIGPEYFQTMSIPFLLGRNFYPGEKDAVIVSESLARVQWPGENPLGKKFFEKAIVVGVVGNARVNSLVEDDTVEMYQAAQLSDMPEMAIVMKTRGAPEGLTTAVKSILANADPKLFPEIRLLKSAFQSTMKSFALAAMIVSLIGVVAVLLAGVGMIGLVAYSVSQRLKEFAIRMALGAKRGQVLTAVLRQFLWPSAIGLVTGMAVAAGGSRILRHVLFGVSNLDPLSYLAALVFLVAVVISAALLPARRALRVDLGRLLHVD